MLHKFANDRYGGNSYICIVQSFKKHMYLRIQEPEALGLCYLHQDCRPALVHRDVKPSNILLDSDMTARVADFGVAKLIRTGSEAMSSVIGSYGYIAPGKVVSNFRTISGHSFYGNINFLFRNHIHSNILGYSLFLNDTLSIHCMLHDCL